MPFMGTGGLRNYLLVTRRMNEVNDEGGGLLMNLVDLRGRHVDDNICSFLSRRTCDYGCHLGEAYGTST